MPFILEPVHAPYIELIAFGISYLRNTDRLYADVDRDADAPTIFRTAQKVRICTSY